MAARPTAIHARIRAAGRRSRRAVARTVHRNRPRLGEFGSNRGPRGAPFGSFRDVEGFYFVGGALAAWALLVSALGVMREDFPSTSVARHCANCPISLPPTSCMTPRPNCAGRPVTLNEVDTTTLV